MNDDVTYFQRFINISDLIIREEIIQKRLLFHGYVDFLSLVEELKDKTDFENLKRVFKTLSEQNWIIGYLKINKSKDMLEELNYNFIFRIHPSFAGEILREDKWKSKISLHFMSVIDKLGSIEYDINKNNDNVIFDYLFKDSKEELKNEKLDYIISSRPFLSDYKNPDSIKDFIINFNVENFNKDILIETFYKKKNELEREEKRKRLTNKVSELFEEILYAKSTELEYAFQKKEINIAEGKNIIESYPKEYLIISYISEYKKEVESGKLKLAYTPDKNIDIIKDNGLQTNVSKALEENEKEIDPLLKELLFPTIKVRQLKSMSQADDSESLIIVKSGKLPQLISSLIQKNKTFENPKSMQELYLFFKILSGYAKAAVNRQASLDDSEIAGFSTADQLLLVLKNFKELIESREEVKVLETKAGMALVYENSKFILKLISLFVPSLSKRYAKAASDEQIKFNGIRSALTSKISGREYTTTDSVVRKIINELEKKKSSLFELVSMKNSVENNPQQFIGTVEGSVQRFLHDLLGKEEGKKEFIKKIKPELERLYNLKRDQRQ